MSKLPDVHEAYDELMRTDAIGNVNIAARANTAVLGAAAQVANAKTMAEAAILVRKTIGRSTKRIEQGLQNATRELDAAVNRFTAASDAGTKELARWNEQTARATTGLKWATWALFVAMVVQIGVMLLR